MPPLQFLWLVAPSLWTAGGIFENYVINGQGIEFVGSRLVISEPTVFYSHTHMCKTIKHELLHEHGESGGISFHYKSPIYRQLAVRLRKFILETVYQNEDALTWVRHIADEQRINPIMVSKAYQTLVNDDLLEKKRRLVMSVGEGKR